MPKSWLFQLVVSMVISIRRPAGSYLADLVLTVQVTDVLVHPAWKESIYNWDGVLVASPGWISKVIVLLFPTTDLRV